MKRCRNPHFGTRIPTPSFYSRRSFGLSATYEFSAPEGPWLERFDASQARARNLNATHIPSRHHHRNDPRYLWVKRPIRQLSLGSKVPIVS